jgi:hypothetical protein
MNTKITEKEKQTTNKKEYIRKTKPQKKYNQENKEQRSSQPLQHKIKIIHISTLPLSLHR